MHNRRWHPRAVSAREDRRVQVLVAAIAAGLVVVALAIVLVRRVARRKGQWVELYGRTNARLNLLARTMNAEFVPPEKQAAFAGVRGRAGGCVFDLQVVTNGERTPVLSVAMRHFTTVSTRTLTGDGLEPPALDLERLRTAVEATCYSFASRH